jgi:glycerol kinase
MKKFILAIDQGTTSTRVVIVDSDSLEHLCSHQIELPQHFPGPSMVEHDLNDIWNHTQICITQALSKGKIAGNQIAAIGITNQRETTCAFTKTGEPLARAIVWQDKRTADFCQTHKDKNENIKRITGLPLDPYFSATKMNWLLKNNAAVASANTKNNLLFGTIDTFLLFKLTACKSHKTDASNASRTLLLNLKTSSWDNELLQFFEIQSNCLPTVEDTFHQYGVTKDISALPDGIPILCMIGDQQSALLGQACTIEGMSKCTYGTGAFFLLNTGKIIKQSKHGLLSTIAYRHKGESVYALEGASFIAGAGVQWFRDQLKAIKTSAEIEELALKVKDLKNIQDLFFFPFFSGLGSPYWKSDALASINGMSRSTGLAELSYVLLDGIAQSITDLKEAAEKDLDKKILAFHVDGGACKNNLLMQIQANYNHNEIRRPKQVETTVSGAALGAIIALNNLNPESLSTKQSFDATFSPKNSHEFEQRRTKWHSLIKSIYL